jgi:hypothetical protein
VTEAEALAVCFRNLKGPRKKRLLETARALQTLHEMPKYGSNERVGEAVGVSREMVREFRSLLTLPDSVQRLLEAGSLNLEHGRRLVQLAARRGDLVIPAAVEMQSLRALEARDLAMSLLRPGDASVEDGLRALYDARSTIRKEMHVVVVLTPDEFAKLARNARDRNIGQSELAREVLVDWLSDGTDV